MKRETDKRIGKFLLITAALFCAVMLLVAMVSYVIDPANLFHPDRDVALALQVVDILKTGRNADHLENYDERLVKRYLIYELPKAETVVLGSSRGALISKDMTGDDSFLNLSVTRASVYDIIGMYGVLYQQNKQPGRVILSIDPWWLNDTYDSKYFDGMLNDSYDAFVTAKLGVSSSGGKPVDARYLSSDYVPQGTVLPWQSGGEALGELFHPAYFQSSLEHQFSETAAVVPNGDYLSVYGMLRADGSYCYPQSFRESDAATIEARAREWLPNNVLGCETYAASGDITKHLFQAFVQSLVEDGIEVDFVLTPLNPIVYDHMEQNARYARALQAESWFFALAREFGLDIAGSFNPQTLGATVTDFYDAPHYKYENVAKLVQAVSGKGDAA